MNARSSPGSRRLLALELRDVLLVVLDHLLDELPIERAAAGVLDFAGHAGALNAGVQRQVRPGADEAEILERLGMILLELARNSFTR